jgi:PAS domain S-box-containing protein
MKLGNRRICTDISGACCENRLAHDHSTSITTPVDLTQEEAVTPRCGNCGSNQRIDNWGGRAFQQDLPPDFFPFCHLVEAVFDSIIVHDLAGNIIYANQAAYSSRGYTREEFLRLKVFDLVVSELRETSRRRLEEIASGKVTLFESIHLHKDGRCIHLDVRGRLMDFKDRRYFLEVARDITARVVAERQLKETQELLNSILEHAPTPVYSTSVDGTYRLVNSAWENLTGKQKEDVIGHSYEELFSGGTAESFRQRTRRVVAAGKPETFEEIALIKGKKHYLHTINFPLLGDDSRVTAIGGISIDITQRKEVEEALGESETTLRTLIEANPESFFLMNTQGMVLAANRVMARRLGKSPKEILGTSIYEHSPPAVARRRKVFLEQVAATGRPVRFEDTRGDIYFENHVNPIFDVDGKVSKIAVLGVDITARKRMENALERFSKKLEERVVERTTQLEAVKARMEQIIATTPAVIFTIDPNPPHHVTFVSDHIRNLGYDPGEILGIHFFDLSLVHSDDRELAKWLVESLFEDHQAMAKYRIRKKDGAYAWVQTNARLVNGASGQPVEIVACWTDITRQKQLE